MSYIWMAWAAQSVARSCVKVIEMLSSGMECHAPCATNDVGINAPGASRDGHSARRFLGIEDHQLRNSQSEG